MRVGIDATILGKGKGGVERFLERIVALLPVEDTDNKYIIFVNKEYYPTLSVTENVNWAFYPMPTDNRILARILTFPYLMFKYKLDVLMVQRLAPLWGASRIVVVIHDLVPIKYAKNYKGITNLLVRLFTRFTVFRASLILTPTQTIAAEIRDYYPQVQAPIYPYFNGVDINAFPQRSSEALHQAQSAANKLLFIGAIESRKNLEVVIRALAVSTEMETFELVIVGPSRDQKYAQSLHVLAEQLGVSSRIQYVGFVTNQRLAELYQQAFLLLAPSWDEGFNMPPLEAMASGLPVICSNIPVHQELFKDAAWFFEPDSPESLAKIILTAKNLNHEYVKAVENGVLTTKRYQWRDAAMRIAASLAKI